jgi:Inorganic pyrophosphatase
MNLDRVRAGNDVPNDCNVIIEIPMHGDPIKYEVDKETGAVFVDRFMSTAMHYPCNYGYIPNTLSDDGDPSDVLVLSPVPLITGVVVRCRPIGMLKMDDEAGGDAKILAVPIDKLTGLYRAIHSPDDLPEISTRQIAISSSTTRISSPANGCASRAGRAPTKPRRRSWPALRVTRRRSRSRVSRAL